MTVAAATVCACHCCGQAQRLPTIPPHHRACCVRCGTRLRHGAGHRSRSRTLALATAALIVYPAAMVLPVMRVENFGHAHEAGILDGAATLAVSGHVLIALIVFVCSVIIPLAKLMALLVLSLGGRSLRHRHRALTYHLVEWTGRWGMLDVLLVAILVAALKLGDVVSVTPGAGAVAFAACVLLSLAAAACFDPHQLWAMNGDGRGATDG
ncbi:MAG: paraquat-inducible protein A [Planctomycetota bacterium]